MSETITKYHELSYKYKRLAELLQYKEEIAAQESPRYYNAQIAPPSDVETSVYRIRMSVASLLSAIDAEIAELEEWVKP